MSLTNKHNEHVWCKNCNFGIIFNNGEKEQLGTNRNCFSSLPHSFDDIEKIYIHDFTVKTTEKYEDFYIKYIVDMLKLEDVTIKKNYFEFKAFKNRYFNLLVLTLVRFLFERLGYQSTDYPNYALQFLNLLKNGKSKYRNKLKRFCDFYSRLTDHKNIKYWAEGHSFTPYKVKIKSTKDFLNVKKQGINSVNNFFYNV